MRSTLVDASHSYVQGQLDLERRDPASSHRFNLVYSQLVLEVIFHAHALQPKVKCNIYIFCSN